MSVVIVNTDDKMINSATQEARERRTFSHTREDMSREMMSASVSIKIGVNYFSEKEREREVLTVLNFYYSVMKEEES